MEFLYNEMIPFTSPYRLLSLYAARRHGSAALVARSLGSAQLVVQTVCVHKHLGIFEQPQTVTNTPINGHELDSHTTYTDKIA